MKDWFDWHPLAQTTAIDLEIWDYINPRFKSPLTLLKPVEPVLANFHTPGNILNVQFRQLGKNDREAYQQAQRDYRWEYKMYEKVHSGLVQYRKFLVQTVDPFYLDGYLVETVRETMKRLARLLRPFEQSRYGCANDALGRFQIINQGSKSGEDYARWMASWLSAAKKAVKSGLVSEDRAKEEILLHISLKDMKWYTRMVLGSGLLGTLSYEKLACRFHQELVAEVLEPVKSASASACAQPAIPHSHLELVAKALEPVKPASACTQPAIPHSHLEPVAKALEPVKPASACAQPAIPHSHQPENSPAASDQTDCEKKDEPENSTEASRDTEKHPAPEDTPKIGKELAAPRAYPFKNSWILATSGNVHICNDRSRFITLDDTEKVITVGYDKPARSQGYGKAWVAIRNEAWEARRMVLDHVAYVPDFHMNLVSVVRLEKQGVYYNGLVKQLINKDNKCVSRFFMKLDKPMMEYRPTRLRLDEIATTNPTTQSNAQLIYGDSNLSAQQVSHRDPTETSAQLKRDAVWDSNVIQDNGLTASTKRDSNPESPAPRPCPCGELHRFWQCPYLNEAQQSEGWVEDIKIRQKVDRALRNPVLADIVRVSVERSIQYFHSQKKGKNDPSSSKKYSIQTRAVAKPNEQESILDQAEQSDEKQFIDPQHKKDVGIQFHGPNGFRFRNSWLIASYSDVHVCNDRDRFTEFRDAAELAMDVPTLAKILGYGTAWLYVRDALGERKQMFLHDVAYIPESRANFVSTAALEENEMCFDRNMNQLTDKDYRCVAQTRSIEGYSVLDYNPIASGSSSRFSSPNGDRGRQENGGPSGRNGQSEGSADCLNSEGHDDATSQIELEQPPQLQLPVVGGFAILEYFGQQGRGLPSQENHPNESSTHQPMAFESRIRAGDISEPHSSSSSPKKKNAKQSKKKPIFQPPAVHRIPVEGRSTSELNESPTRVVDN